MDTSDRKSNGLTIFSRVLYVLAVGGMGLAILLGLSVANAASIIPAATIGFQSPAIKPLWDALVSGLNILGTLVFVSGFCVSLLLAAAGVLVGRTGALTRRVQRLEAALIKANLLEQPVASDKRSGGIILTDMAASTPR